MKQWIRGPLISSEALVDYRNNIDQDWQLWGLRYEKNARGNLVNTVFDESGYAAHEFDNQRDGVNVTTDRPIYAVGCCVLRLPRPPATTTRRLRPRIPPARS